MTVSLAILSGADLTLLLLGETRTLLACLPCAPEGGCGCTSSISAQSADASLLWSLVQ